MDAYDVLYDSLTEAQRAAVDWDNGPMLVLAGPGSGKTRVLTGRIARILRESPDKAFRVLALTFTNRAADEMRARVQELCNGGEQRAVVGTFHSFCMQMLQQHGSYVGVTPDFTIYSQDNDRRELLKEGIKREWGKADDGALVRYLGLIDKLKSLLIDVESAAAKFKDPREGENVARAYAAYEAELARVNALDFNSLMLKAYQLARTFEGVAGTYRRNYRYWLIDEFQDTNRAQYRFLRALAGNSFQNIFVVADDDQIIYQWNGASFQQLQRFRTDFEPEVIQLPTNYRCPPAIVNAANNLVRHNTVRTPMKTPLVAAKSSASRGPDSILVGTYANEDEEAQATAASIWARGSVTWSETAVIARSRAMLSKFKKALDDQGVVACIAQRRDDFLSPQYQWLHSLLRQMVRQQDLRNYEVMLSALNKWIGTKFQPELLWRQAEASGRSLMHEWIYSSSSGTSDPLKAIVQAVDTLLCEPSSYGVFVARMTELFEAGDADEDSDLDEDRRAWRALERSIKSSMGRNLQLDQFLQQMALQSKEPPLQHDTVTLMTIHAAKGKEYDYVHLVGLAEDVLPSFQSLKAGDLSPEMEEERRNCFVAITRAKEQLVLTRAKAYRGYAKKPSRFWAEMGIQPQP